MTRSRPRRCGRSRLIDLFVLMMIVAVALVIIPPWLQPQRIYVRQAECMVNMRNVAQALNAYELTQRHYPGYSNVLKLHDGQIYSDQASGKPRGVSYIIPLLPYLDEPEVEKVWKDPAATEDQRQGKNVKPNHPRMLICPTDPPIRNDGWCALSYVVNCGMADISGSAGSPTKPGMPRDWAANGVFFDLFTGNPLLTSGTAPVPSGSSNDDFGIYDSSQPGLPMVGMSADYISRSDGTAYTCLLSENVDAGRYTDDIESLVGIVWNGSGKVDSSQHPPTLNPPDENMRINVNPGGSELQDTQARAAGSGGPGSPQWTAFARPSAFHSGGVNMAFCDGKVRFVSDSMDYYVYCLLMSSNGAKVKMPGSIKVLPNFDRMPMGSWYIE